MKNVFLLFVAISLTQSAFGSDKFSDTIVCSKVTQPGEADNGLDVIIQTNPTAWVKRVSVMENGYLGPKEIGSFQIPVNQPLVSAPSISRGSHVAVYQVEGFSLTMNVSNISGSEPTGPAHASIILDGLTPIEVELDCQNVNL